MKYENIEINIPGRPGPWLKHNGKLYCFFSTDNDRYSSVPTHHFYILDEKGKIESRIVVPEKLQTFYYDLYMRNDTIFTTEYYDQNTFYLEKDKWIETKKGIDLFYEDNNYNVYSLDFGEWGGTIWFEDKKTRKQYEYSITSPIINRLENAYFITSGSKILKIDNPQKMELSKLPYDYKKVVLEKKDFRNPNHHSLKGAEIIYDHKGDNPDDLNPRFPIMTSFISNNRLFHIYKDSISTKIGKIENRNLTPVYNFKFDIQPFQWHYDWRNQIQNNSYQTFQFFATDKKDYGILEVDKNDITITTFKNSYKETVFGETRINKWFEKYFEYYFRNFDSIALQEIESIEQKENATNITQKDTIFHHLLDGREIPTPKIYRKIENSNLSVNILYYYTAKEKTLELIEFEWGKNLTNFKNAEGLNTDSENQNKSNILYKSKFDWISNYLLRKFGKPYYYEQDDKSKTQEWITGNKIIELVYNQNLVRLTMYKKR
ncbi:hypothetical protein GVN16_21240 [Emticicia sp. CRIBPO]|uniref:hypothetical protein n=1 Tax=Emticicia sp. CRIBPO TaxID=2683258 RepID=UPI0014131689|nr:hypothetical protein [Emticicia sp. CRIBPO]NBA88311.1 hypothetical protein [Emticicia sp. CRIBPO]